MNDRPNRHLNGNAIASVALGVAWPVIGSIAAIVLGRRARAELARPGATERGARLAAAGIAIGWFGLVGYPLMMILAFLGLASMA